VHAVRSFSNYLNKFIQYFELETPGLQEERLQEMRELAAKMLELVEVKADSKSDRSGIAI
jgi:hypothetical protein